MKHNIAVFKNKGVTEYFSTRGGKTQPKIMESFISDEGESMYILDNGNSISQTNYEAHWVRTPQPILPKGTK